MHANDAPLYGLTQEQVRARREQGRTNTMPRRAEGGLADILRRNVLTLFNLLNLCLAGLLLWVGSHRDMLFLGVVLSNTLIGTIQELRAKRTHDRLKLLSEGQVRVMRDGAECLLSPHDLVLDDVVLLSRGDQVPADARVLSGTAEADESLLTGESVPVSKAADDALYSGSFLVSGSVAARLTAVGADSYAGQLQLSARRVKRAQSELMRDMRRIIRWVSAIILPIGVAMFSRQYASVELGLQDAVTGTVASVLGMIPEGLILLTSVSLAAGVVALGRRNALVNELFGIETLARTDVVCMDKTGTLTSGEMILDRTLPLGKPRRRRSAHAWRRCFRPRPTQPPPCARCRRRFPPRTRRRSCSRCLSPASANGPRYRLRAWAAWCWARRSACWKERRSGRRRRWPPKDFACWR